MNLIYCTSPLQALIAERIIDLYPNEQFYCVFDGNPKQTKQWHYYERLKARCKGGTFISRSGFDGALGAYRFVLRILFMGYFRLPRIHRIFVASLDSYVFRLLWAGVRGAQLYTFDDGSVNLSSRSFFLMNDVDDGKFLGLIQKLFRIPNIKEFKERSLKHYTIYEYPNVMPRCEYISLYPDKNTPDKQNTGSVESPIRVMSIFLGQRVFSWEVFDEDIALAEWIVKHYGIDYYLPHPKESYTIKGVEYIQTPLIAEDYILQILEENPDLEVRLYSYCSTALLNLSATPRVRVQGFRPKRCLDFLEETFDLYKEVGIPVVDLDWERDSKER